MTDEQKKEIRLLRYSGWGYDRIANYLGVSRELLEVIVKEMG